MRNKFTPILFLFLTAALLAQPLPKGFSLNEVPYYRGLASNGVSEIRVMGDSLIWFGTGAGLSYTPNYGDSIFSFYPDGQNLPRGGISAIAVKDSLLWVAGAFDSTVKGIGTLSTGGGLAFSTDSGTTWTFLQQPVDDPDSLYITWNDSRVNILPVTTPIFNVTYDIAINPPYVYVVSWAGGLRRYNLDTGKWQIIPLPPDDKDYLFCEDSIDFRINPQDPINGGNHNHKGFSVLAYGDTIWVGTANGINRGLIEGPECINWTKYTAQNSGISGNFVVALGRQVYKGKETIWAATLPAEGAVEYHGVSKTRDGGNSWQVVLKNVRAYNFAFQDSIVYVASEDGLYKSIDGENFALYPPVDLDNANQYIFSENVFCAAVSGAKGREALWIGTADGVAYTLNDGQTWRVMRRAISTQEKDEPLVYAYPNPFSPGRHNYFQGDGHVRFQYYLNAGDVPARVSLEIYNFAMEQVVRVIKNRVRDLPGDQSEIWTGRDDSGRLVANGVYFCKLTLDTPVGEKIGWTKLIIIK